jgi:hypothetical protein
MSGELVYVSNDDHGKLIALLDERRKMVKRHEAGQEEAEPPAGHAG